MAASHIQKTLLASAARTAATNSADQRNRNHMGVRIHIKVTARTGASSNTFTIQGKDNLTGDYYTILASAAVAATGETYLVVYPGIAAAANASVSTVLPAYWRVNVAAGTADSMTYQVTAELLA